jgi:hypothetical protein
MIRLLDLSRETIHSSRKLHDRQGAGLGGGPLFLTLGNVAAEMGMPIPRTDIQNIVVTGAIDACPTT